MAEKCHRTQDIDLALFLIEPHSSEWQEFRAHYPQCTVCSAELQKWTTLEHRLRAIGDVGATNHPSAETLVQFQQRSPFLSPETRQTIAEHVSTCVTCREEVQLLSSFDPSRIAQWVADTQMPVTVDTHESWSMRVWHALRPLVLHPAFAVGLVLLLSVPFIRLYYQSSINQAPISVQVAPSPAPASSDVQLQQEQTSRFAEQQAVEPAPQVAGSASRPIQESAPIAPALREMAPRSEARKTKENVQPTPLAKRSTPREDLANKDERAPVPLPASPAPSFTTGLGMRDEQLIPQQKNRTGVEEKKQETFSEPQKSVPIEEREARSTEGPVTEQRRREEDSPPLAATARVPLQTAARLQESNAPQERRLQTVLSTLMERYKQAYQARDLHALGLVWNMDQTWQTTLTQLFAENQQITITFTLDENNLTESADQQQISVPLTQFVTTVSHNGQASTHGPCYCLADIRKQSTGQWTIHALQEDAQYPGQCRLQ